MSETEKIINGYRHIRLGPQCFAAIPLWFDGETVPDEYVFDPEWNREAINRYWRMRETQP